MHTARYRVSFFRRNIPLARMFRFQKDRFRAISFFCKKFIFSTDCKSRRATAAAAELFCIKEKESRVAFSRHYKIHALLRARSYIDISRIDSYYTLKC